ncbi:MAG: hypothetical protein U0835_09190 [Isosphaeraceae bacterium]
MSDLLLIEEPEPLLIPVEPAEAKPAVKRRGLFQTCRRGFVWFLRGIASLFDWLFGALALTLGLAVLASLPVLQLLCLGYILEASGRVARTGRLRDGLIGVRKASRLGSTAIGVSLFLIPLNVASSLANSAELIDPGGIYARRWRAAMVILTVLVTLQILGACARGGRIRHFLMPFGNPFWIVRRVRRGGSYAAARDAVSEFVSSLRLPYYFRLGFFGFIGTMAWIGLPVLLLEAGRRAPVLGFVGALLLGLVVLRLPFLQAGYAVDGRFRSLFAWKTARQRFRRAPWAFSFALFLTLIFALPLYLLKIEMIPRETAFLPSLVFLLFIFPARLLAGWAYGRSLRREPPRHGFFRWTGRFAMLPVATFYVLVVYFTQYTAWRGIWSLYEQHAFLLPVPFLGM